MHPFTRLLSAWLEHNAPVRYTLLSQSALPMRSLLLVCLSVQRMIPDHVVKCRFKHRIINSVLSVSEAIGCDF